jgi:hypothetical protein
VVVHVADNTDAPIPGATVNLSFNGTPACASATLSGTLTTQTDANGNASFANLSVDHGQNGYALSANVQGLTAISNPFNVTGFCETGNMITARRNHMVIALPNGKILVTGGAANADGTGSLASAELYDPVAHTFSSTVNTMSTSRVDHTVTLLLNGEVLVTGGYSDTTNAQPSADLYFTANNVFNPVTAQMTTPRAEHAATLLANGKVLITGGNDNNGNTLASAEIFDPTANTFTATAQPMNSVRQAHHADLLPNGKVLISGGLDGNNNALASAEIYDPVAGTFTPTGNMTTARGNHSSALLYTGQILVAGGLTGPGTGLVLTATAELYNPGTGTFTPTANMSVARGHYAGIVLDDGTDFISGGATLPAGINADIYNPVTQTFSVSGNFTAAQTGMREAVAPDGTVLLASGVNNAVPAVTVPNSELFYPAPLPAGIVITTPTTLPAAVQNVPLTQLILEHGGVGNLTWSIGTVPSGITVTVTTNGILTATATQAGTFSIPVTVFDSSTPTQTTTVQFTLQVTGSLAITTTTLPNGVVGTAYNSPIVTTGGTQPVSFSLATAAFPPGLTITQPAPGTQTGALAGTPTTAGTYNFSETVIDQSSPQQTATQNYTVTIVAAFAGTTPNTLPNGTAGVAYSQALTSTGGTAPFTYQFVSGTPFPPGLSISSTGPTTAVLSGTPTSAGTFTFAYQAADSSTPAQGYSEFLKVSFLPQPPTGLIAAYVPGTTTVNLGWTASTSGGVTGYNVYRGTTSGGPYTQIGSSTGTNFTDGNATGGTTFYYVVTATAPGSPAILESAFSAQLPVSTN